MKGRVLNIALHRLYREHLDFSSMPAPYSNKILDSRWRSFALTVQGRIPLSGMGGGEESMKSS